MVWRELREDLKQHGVRSGGFWALAFYRYGRWSLERRSPVARWASSKLYGAAKPVVDLLSGVDLDRHTVVGKQLHIVHASNIQIHPAAVIGDRVGIMHGVTIGTNMGEDVPVIGSDVFIGCNASVLGKVTIGDGARIAANSLVITDVPKGAVAIGVPARVGPDLSAMRKSTPPPALPKQQSAQDVPKTSKADHD
ncbi:MAG TPA: hypothetical protein VI299_26095 [Polyangiales bacterium]